jgi:transcription elongation factor Elf1
MFQCPNCGGNLKFDIPSQQLGCEYCNARFDPYGFENKTSDAVEEKGFEGDYEVTIFTCPQCGGEILSTDNAAAGFCSFCGASTILYSRISKERRPQYIIPFKKTKEDCKQAYANLMRKAIFAPKELKNPQKIDGFRGIYMPYWAFYITQKGDIALRAEKSHRRGDYIITDHYSLQGDLDAYYKGLSYDASSSFADNISETIAPYDVKGMKAFTPSYLSGFYADTADVAPLAYQPEAEQFAFDESMQAVRSLPAFSGYTISKPQNGSFSPSFFHTKTEAADQAMFPVWFMSYRNGDRVAYATVNGQTGKVVSDLPVDVKKYLLGSLVLALPLFILFNLFMTLTPVKLLTLCAIIALVAVLISTIEIKSIIRRENDTDDKGVLAVKNPEKLSQMNRQIKSKVSVKSSSGASTAIVVIILVCFLFTFGVSVISSLGSMLSSGLIWLVLLIASIVIAVIGLSSINQVPGKKGLVGLITALVGIAVGTTVRIIHPVSDIYYYGAAILSLVAVFFTLKDVIEQYNILSTRKLPQFDRQGGDDRA